MLSREECSEYTEYCQLWILKNEEGCFISSDVNCCSHRIKFKLLKAWLSGVVGIARISKTDYF